MTQKRVPNTAITFDIDWAPDWAIRLCADLCNQAGVPATFFVTHDSPVLNELRRESDRFELGIHPNMLAGSDHGRSPEAILDHCLSIVPEAVSMRTHGLYQSTPFLATVCRRTPIEVDLSILLPFHPHLQATTLHCGPRGRRLVRLPYFWEDDVIAAFPEWDWSAPLPLLQDKGLHIFDFHPIHVVLNMADMDTYENLKKFMNGRPMASLTEAECRPFCNPGCGTRTYLRSLLARRDDVEFATPRILARYSEAPGA
jgi:hypothetical protein